MIKKKSVLVGIVILMAIVLRLAFLWHQGFVGHDEYAYLDPRYLLGMVSIWPVFIAVALGKRTNIKLVNSDANNIHNLPRNE